MNSRPIIQSKKLKIYLDSESIADLLDKGDITANKLLNWAEAYQDILNLEISYEDIWTNYVEFFRSPFDSNYDKLNKVKSYEFKLIEDFDYKEYYFRYKGHWTLTHEIPGKMCENILKGVESDILEKITSLMVNFYEFSIREGEDERASNYNGPAFSLCISENTNLLVTNNKVLLKNRLELEESLTEKSIIVKNYPLNIVTVKEANEIIDLFLKYRNLYFYGMTNLKGTITYTTDFNEADWYYASFVTKVPYFYPKDGLSESFGNRFIFVLMSIDELGKLYYHGVNGNKQMGMLYNFNYFISLITGIFDNLALITNKKFNIYNDEKKVSLNPDSINDFISKLKDKDTNLYKHIHDNIDFLRLIHKLRNKIIHREMFNIAVLKSGEIQLNTLIINEEILGYLRCYPKEIHKTKIHKTKRLELWGVHRITELDGSEKYFIEPFHFSKEAAKILIEFSNNYLKLLGNSNSLEEFMKKYKDTLNKFYCDLIDFEKVNLGF